MDVARCMEVPAGCCSQWRLTAMSVCLSDDGTAGVLLCRQHMSTMDAVKATMTAASLHRLESVADLLSRAGSRGAQARPPMQIPARFVPSAANNLRCPPLTFAILVHFRLSFLRQHPRTARTSLPCPAFALPIAASSVAKLPQASPPPLLPPPPLGAPALAAARNNPTRALPLRTQSIAADSLQGTYCCSLLAARAPATHCAFAAPSVPSNISTALVPSAGRPVRPSATAPSCPSLHSSARPPAQRKGSSSSPRSPFSTQAPAPAFPLSVPQPRFFWVWVNPHQNDCICNVLRIAILAANCCHAH